MMSEIQDVCEPDPIPEESPVGDINHESSQQHQQQIPQQPVLPQAWPLPVGHPMASHPAPPPLQIHTGNPALLQYYEAQMRDHAAAYASAAAAAAMTAAQIAANIASSGGGGAHPQGDLPYPNSVPMSPIGFPESPHMYPPANFFPPTAYPHLSSLPMSSQPPTSNQRSDSFPEDNRSTSSGGGSHYQRRRKRQQRIPPSGSPNQYIHSFQDPHYNTYGHWQQQQQQQQGQQKRGRRRRRFWNDAGSSDSGDPSYSTHNNPNNPSNNLNNRRRNRKMAKATAASSSSDGSWITKKKQRQPNDDSLLGKTGVSALYEWCMKRRTTPTFSMIAPSDNKTNSGLAKKSPSGDSIPAADQTVQKLPKENIDEGKRRRLELEQDFFETTVSIDGIVMGKGRGRTKTAAKHEASRRALLTLLPGVKFDDETGILMQLPGGGPEGKTKPSATITSLEDLAPNLAKQLAIGHSNDDEERGTHSRTNQEHPMTATRKRQKWPHVYPGTSTTSDDEDEDSYYASRGAYVCSSLLHAMVQIDDRLTEPPEFTYQVSTITNEPGSEHSKLKRKASVPIKATSTSIPRGSFQCIGQLKLKITSPDDDSTDRTATDGDEGGENDSFEGSSAKHQPSEDSFRLLRSFGVGGTKREARHTAAAQLLSQLFPECEGMAQVKQAAEAAREKYAASRALKQQSKREAFFTATAYSRTKEEPRLPPRGLHQERGGSTLSSFFLPSASEKIPSVPDSIQNGIRALLAQKPHDTNGSSSTPCDKAISTRSAMEAGLVRQLSRQHQLEERIDLALQKLNEHDEEGRSLPEELTVDDVGRTVLRRASSDDIHWVEKLFRTKSLRKKDSTKSSSPLFGAILASDKVPSPVSTDTHTRLWSSSTIVLLLCRAIAPHEDPPLGCAVLTLGFSMQLGKTLRIAQIASKSHQPRERFIERLSKFATNMGCSLISASSSASCKSFDALESDFLSRTWKASSTTDPCENSVRDNETARRIKNEIDVSPILIEEHRVKPSLQSVPEGGEGVEESDSSAPNNDKEKRREKPSKRSRFQ